MSAEIIHPGGDLPSFALSSPPRDPADLWRIANLYAERLDVADQATAALAAYRALWATYPIL